MDLRDRVANKLAGVNLHRMGTHDIVVEYCIRAYTKESCIHEAEGAFTLASVRHPRLVPTAPGKLEAAALQQIVEPLSAALYDTLSPESEQSLVALSQQVGQEFPALENAGETDV